MGIRFHLERSLASANFLSVWVKIERLPCGRVCMPECASGLSRCNSTVSVTAFVQLVSPCCCPRLAMGHTWMLRDISLSRNCLLALAYVGFPSVLLLATISACFCKFTCPNVPLCPMHPVARLHLADYIAQNADEAIVRVLDSVSSLSGFVHADMILDRAPQDLFAVDLYAGKRSIEMAFSQLLARLLRKLKALESCCLCLSGSLGYKAWGSQHASSVLLGR